MNISHWVYPQASEILRKRGNGRKIRSFKNENDRTFKIARNKCHAINLTCNVISVVCNVQFTWHMPICKDLRIKKWKSVTLSFNKALVNWFLNSIKKESKLLWRTNLNLYFVMFICSKKWLWCDELSNKYFFQYQYLKTTATAKCIFPSDLI